MTNVLIEDIRDFIDGRPGRSRREAAEEKARRTRMAKDKSHAFIVKCADCNYTYMHVGNQLPCQTIGTFNTEIRKQETKSKNLIVKHCRDYKHDLSRSHQFVDEFNDKISVSRAHALRDQYAEKYKCDNAPSRIKALKELAHLPIQPKDEEKTPATEAIPEAKDEEKTPAAEAKEDDTGYDSIEEDISPKTKKNINDLAVQYPFILTEEQKAKYEKKIRDLEQELNRLKA